MRKYLKEKKKRKGLNEVISKLDINKIVRAFTINKFNSLLIFIAILSLFIGTHFSFGESDLAGIDVDTKSYMSAPLFSTTPAKTATLSIPTGIVKANPFMPYRDIDGLSNVPDVPEFDLVPPPDSVGIGSNAARAMDTIVSGILYDKFSPSAILNIEGNDYLVKKGDVVNGYKIVSIVRDSVTVKLGSNVYKAGIGEILTEGELNYNEVSNLQNKFGGVK